MSDTIDLHKLKHTKVNKTVAKQGREQFTHRFCGEPTTQVHTENDQ